MNDKPNTKVKVSMPEDAAKRLMEKFKADPEGFKKEFRDAGFEILDICVEDDKVTP